MKRQRETGGVLMMAVAMLPMAAGLCGLALELSIAFQRQAQLQQLADAAALTAAQQLDGTPESIGNACSKAALALVGRTVRGVGNVSLPQAALSFASGPDGPWLSSGDAAGAPAGLRYARADMGALGADFTTVPHVLGTLLGGSPITAGARAVAGPNGARVLPFAVCAPSSTPVGIRFNGNGLNERVDYGFRFGVGYNLLALNPAAGASSGEYFLLDPVSPPGTPALPASTEDSQLAPFMCTGKLAYFSLAGALHLRRPAGFGLWEQLNSRFGTYAGNNACDPYSAPPDTNVREYRGALASWMNSNPPQASAASSTPAAGKPLMTIADGSPPLPAVAPAQYGTLWAFGPARRNDGTGGGGNFTTGSWGTLYPAAPALNGSSWPTTLAPYAHASYSTAPSSPGRKGRRLLYVPLLSCPIAAGTNVDGTVLAVARFLLTARASANEVPGEFTGILSAKEVAALATDVELLR